MRKLLLIGAFISLMGCASSGTKTPDLIGQYYMNEQKIVYTKVKPPYSEYKYPVRFGEKVLRIWIAPRIVNDYIMIEGHYAYITVSKSRWYVEPEKPLYR